MASTTRDASFQMASVYVADLHPEINETALFEKFSKVGPILSIRVCRTSNTHRPLGYAYVTFVLSADAERAVVAFNFDGMEDQPFRVMRCQRDPNVRCSAVGNIFLKGLHKNITSEALHDTFYAFGDINSCKVATDDNGQSKGYGYIQFKKEEDANTATKMVNGKLILGEKVFVGPFVTRQERQKEIGEKKPVSTNVYVKNIAEDIDDEKLKTMFESFGKITSCKVMFTDDGKSKGFGFVAFDTTEAAQAAVGALNGQKVNETKNLYVARVQTNFEREEELKRKSDDLKKQRNEYIEGANLYVKNLDSTFDDERLRQVFSVYGTITSAKVMTHESGSSKGFGFVCYNDPNEATSAITALNGRVVGAKPLYVTLAQRKEDRQAFLKSEFGWNYKPDANHSYTPTPMRSYPSWAPQESTAAGTQGIAQPGIGFTTPMTSYPCWAPQEQIAYQGFAQTVASTVPNYLLTAI